MEVRKNPVKAFNMLSVFATERYQLEIAGGHRPMMLRNRRFLYNLSRANWLCRTLCSNGTNIISRLSGKCTPETVDSMWGKLWTAHWPVRFTECFMTVDTHLWNSGSNSTGVIFSKPIKWSSRFLHKETTELNFFLHFKSFSVPQDYISI